MGRIKVLADSLINRIAAGEVVERPASVVKELVENSLDAGATRVEVLLRAGGRQEIRVTDDGRGMDRDDALLAVERHATSKVASADDLHRIATLGFRGEALSSIAAVSRFTLATAVADGEGTEVEVHGGRIHAVRQAGLPKGTSIRVERLFYNVPARRKFLRGEGTELSHILRWMTRYALAFPEKTFRLQQGDRRLLDAEATPEFVERITQIYGREFAERLLPFEGRQGDLLIHGFAGRPVDGLPRRDHQHYVINGRAVQDRVLSHAVMDAYGNTMPRGRFPAIVLLIKMDPDAVDVNVHPQKTEVRFRSSSEVHDLTREAVAAALSQESAIPSLTELRPDSIPSPAASSVRESTLRYFDRSDRPDRSATSFGEATSDVRRYGPPPRRPVPSMPSGEFAGNLVDDSEQQESVPRRIAVPLAQYRESYIVAQDKEGLVLVDQHAAHERVIFERYLADAQVNEVETQRLLFPVTVDLAPSDAALVDAELEEFRRLGFSLEPFGGNSVRLDAIPAVGSELDPEAFFREVLGEADRCRSATADVSQIRHKLVTTAACHAAIKVNYPLTSPEMQQLLDDLYQTENPTTCPHGRPAVFRLTLDEIERAFRRR